MATNAFASSFATLSVSATAPATNDAAGYAALTWTEVGDVISVDRLGFTTADVPHSPLNDPETYHLKGSKDRGTTTVQCAAVFVDDAGQVIMETASESSSDYYFKFEFNDNPDGTSNTIRYFPAKVGGDDIQIGGRDSIVGRTFNLMHNGAPVHVDMVA